MNKIPALVLDNGFIVYDRRVICEYLDTLRDGPGTLPAAGFERLMALRNQAHGDGIVDAAMTRLVERNKPEARRTPEIVAVNERKTREAVARLEKDVAMNTKRSTTSATSQLAPHWATSISGSRTTTCATATRSSLIGMQRSSRGHPSSHRRLSKIPGNRRAL